ncbi:LURP-one-related/scramblase family protein [Streptococcus cameli]
MRYIVHYAGNLFQQAFEVKDETGNKLYSIRGKNLMWLANTSITDTNDQEAALLKQKFSLTHYSYNVLIGGQQVANVTKKIASLKPKFIISGLDWSVEGQFLSREYTLYNKQREVIATINRQGLLEDGAYAFEVTEATTDPLLVLAVLTAIDTALMQK